MSHTLAKRATAFVVAACMTAQPAIAAITDISAVPLASSAGATFLPNLLFTLDESGSMGWDYLPDYVNDTNTCMVSDDGTACQRGDPPYEAGGQTGFNGVGYDPNFTYLPGLTSNGQPVLNPPSGTLTETSVPPDAYLGGTNVNITTNSKDNRYCNGTGGGAVCKRNGADNAGVVTPVGVDAQGNVLGAGQFPYRTHASNSSLLTYGLPEMMSIGRFSRAGNTVTADTVEAHGLAVGNRIYVTGTGSGGIDLTNVAVATVPNANRFTYTSTSSGTITARDGSYRKQVALTPATAFHRPASNANVTVTSTAHGLVTGDIIRAFTSNNQLTPGGTVTITKVDNDSFTYPYPGSGNSVQDGSGSWVRTGLYNVRTPINSAPAVYRMTPIEYCSDAALTDCTLVIPPAIPPASHPYAATVRFCRTRGEALAPGLVTGTSVLAPATTPTPRCQLKYVNTTGLQTYLFPRLGWFIRDTVTSGVGSYTSRPSRSDCVAGTCTYAQEIQNYARWFTYYSNRMRMMKTSAGRAFLPFISNPTGTPSKPDRLRVGFITINPTIPNGGGSVDQGPPSNPGPLVLAEKYLKIDNFNTTHASNWYTKFYEMIPSDSTPNRSALSRAGWIFAGKLNTGLTNGIPTADDPIQASCQKNYSIFTTDGFWNQGPGFDIAGNTLLNHDNVDNQVIAPYTDKMVSRASGTYDGNILPGTTAGSSPGGRGTLADIAMYYYKTDLRGGTDTLGNATGPATSPNTTPPGGDVSTNNVTPGPKDFVTHQHMTTFTVGLIDGLMRYQADYESSLTGDFANIKTGATGCFWSAGICNWPSPQENGQTALDDLWHAAVNGRGTFYSALNPNALATGLTDALNKLDIDFASAAAAATSSPNVASGAEFAFSTRYQTANWAGEVYAQKIDPLTGQVSDFKEWRAHDLLLARVTANSDTRNIWMFDSATGTKLKPFSFPSMTAAEKAFFSNKCIPLSNMSQCTTLTPFQLIDANDGDQMVRFLRGQTGKEATLFRDRQEILDEPGDPRDKTPVQTIMGDIINAQPLFVPGKPFFEYSDPGYTTFKNVTLTGRRGALYIAANDGYLHAFDGSTGFENWAYMPKFAMPAVHQIADSGYAGKHRFFLDGTPEFQDVFDVSTSTWKTVIVGGAGAGARGYYALDITDPQNPKGLWEFCSDPTLCAITDPDLGLAYGNPVIGKRKLDGKWVVVVTSGLNNVTPGDGRGYFYVLDAITGQILHKISTGSGDTTTPSGLVKVGGWYDKGLADAQFDWIYGGDQNGDIWRMDMNQAMPAYVPLVAVPPTTFPVLMHFARLKEPGGTGRLQPITARPVATPLTVTGLGRKRIVYFATGRYLGNSDLSDIGIGGPAWVQSIYGLMDKDTGVSLGDVRASGTLVQQTLSPLAPGKRAVSKNGMDWTARSGFYIDLLPNIDAIPTDGERVVLDLQLVLGTLVVTSTIPERGGCTPGGFSYQYNLDFKTGGYVGNSAPADGSGSKSKLIVGTAIVQTSDGSIKAINKSYTGENSPSQVSIEPFTQMKRFSYRER